MNTELSAIATELQAVENEIASILEISNELQDRYQTLSRADAKALRNSPEWQVVERWKELVLRRAKLRDAYELLEIELDPHSPRWQE